MLLLWNSQTPKSVLRLSSGALETQSSKEQVCTSAVNLDSETFRYCQSRGICISFHKRLFRVSNLFFILSHFPPELNSYLYIDASPKTEQQRARLVSPVVAADTGPLCLLFSYQLLGEAQGHLRVRLGDSQNEEGVLWMLKDDQGPVWKEGRTILPRSPKDFQVAFFREKMRFEMNFNIYWYEKSQRYCYKSSRLANISALY